LKLAKQIHRRQKRKYFIFGTIIFGILAMIIVKILKKKEEKSDWFHRSGVSIPLE
jgi:hypothetical protein